MLRLQIGGPVGWQVSVEGVPCSRSRLPRALTEHLLHTRCFLFPARYEVEAQVEQRAGVTQQPFLPFLWSHRWLQPRVGMGLPDAWGLPSVQQQTRGRTRGNEYQPSNIKRKHKHGWIRRLSTPTGVQVILRRMLKGRKSLSH